MNPALKSVMRMYLKDKWSWFLIPWIIVLSSFVINLIIGGTVPREETGFYTGGMSSIFIYMFVAGIVNPSQTFPFALGFSVRRIDYFWGTSTMVLLLSAFTSVVLTSLSFIEVASNSWGVGLHFFHLPYVSDGNAFEQFWINMLFILFLFYSGFVIFSIHRKFGRNGIYAFFIGCSLVISLVGFLFNYLSWWDDIFGWFRDYSLLGIMNWSVLPTAALMFISFLFLRRSTV